MRTLVGLIPLVTILASTGLENVVCIGEEDWESTESETAVLTAYDAAVQRVTGALEESAPLLLVQDDLDEVRLVVQPCCATVQHASTVQPEQVHGTASPAAPQK